MESNFIEFNTINDTIKFIEKIIKHALLNNDVQPGDYLLLQDDGIVFGNENEFSDDALAFATKIDDIVDFRTNNINHSAIEELIQPLIEE